MTPSLQDFKRLLENLPGMIEGVEGHLTPREVEFLALLAAYPTTSGDILEIGSFKGRSTIVLAKAAALAGDGRVVAVDPLTSPSVTDPDLGGETSGLRDFEANLRKAGVEQRVEFHQMYSSELAGAWDGSRKIRLLWVDGDHTYAGAKADFDMFSPFLSDGSIVAFHDVLHEFDGPIRVMVEDILASERFGACGICGSIGWGQYFEDPVTDPALIWRKNKLRQNLIRFIPFSSVGKDPGLWTSLKRSILRARIPHSDINPKKWLVEVIFVE